MKRTASAAAVAVLLAGAAHAQTTMEAHARTADDRLSKYFPEEAFDRGEPVSSR